MALTCAILFGAAGAYVLAGLLFALVFVTRGVVRIDPAAADAGVGFRLIILPGVTALWPLLLIAWLREVRR